MRFLPRSGAQFRHRAAYQHSGPALSRRWLSHEAQRNRDPLRAASRACQTRAPAAAAPGRGCA